jgi:hypothetical protein
MLPGVHPKVSGSTSSLALGAPAIAVDGKRPGRPHGPRVISTETTRRNVTRDLQAFREWSQPGSNRRPPACKAGWPEPQDLRFCRAFGLFYTPLDLVLDCRTFRVFPGRYGRRSAVAAFSHAASCSQQQVVLQAS